MTRWPSFITAFSGANRGDMNRLKLIAGVLLIFFTGIAAGHLGTVFYFKNKIYKQGPPALHHLIKKKMSHELHLTQPQQIKFDKIIAQAEKNFDAFRQKHHPELEQNLTECFKKINEILTPAQQKKFEKIKNRFKRGFPGPKGFSSRRPFGKRPFAQPDELEEILNLSEDQVKHIAPIIYKYNQDVKNIFMDDRVPMDDHDQEMPNHRARRDKIKQIEDNLASQIKPYLNDNQINEFQEILKNRHPRHADEP